MPFHKNICLWGLNKISSPPFFIKINQPILTPWSFKISLDYELFYWPKPFALYLMAIPEPDNILEIVIHVFNIQVMAIATLERCYNNLNVFRGVVKIRKGEAVRMMMEATNMTKVKAIFTHFAKQVSQCELNSFINIFPNVPYNSLMLHTYHINFKKL